jgi:hypothetical protein
MGSYTDKTDELSAADYPADYVFTLVVLLSV